MRSALLAVVLLSAVWTPRAAATMHIAQRRDMYVRVDSTKRLAFAIGDPDDLLDLVLAWQTAIWPHWHQWSDADRVRTAWREHASTGVLCFDLIDVWHSDPFFNLCRRCGIEVRPK